MDLAIKVKIFEKQLKCVSQMFLKPIRAQLSTQRKALLYEYTHLY